jgi:hypothetical protein
VLLLVVTRRVACACVCIDTAPTPRITNKYTKTLAKNSLAPDLLAKNSLAPDFDKEDCISY